MQNLLQNALIFMFKPESTFSVIFLIILISCFLYGIILKNNCLKYLLNFSDNAVQEYNNVKTHYLPDVFVALHQKILSVKESKISDLQNVFVSVGILGTFIGLGIAIKGAAELLNNENIDISKLNAVLGVIAFKFQISVWGTIFSLIFQKLVAESYFEKKEIILTNVLHNLYNDEIEIRTTLERHLLATEKIEEANNNQLNELSNMQSNFKNYVDSSVEFANNVKLFGGNVGIYHKQMIETIEKISHDFITEQEQLKKYVGEIVEKFIENVNDMQEKMQNGQMEMENLQNEIHVNIIRSIETLQKAFVRSEDKYMRDAQDRFNSMLKTSLVEIHREYVDAAHSLKIVVDKLNNELNGVDNEVNSLRTEFINDQKLFSKTMKEAIELENQHRDRIQVCYSNMEKMWTEMSKSVEANNLNFQNFIVDVQKDLKSLEDKYFVQQVDMQNKFELFVNLIKKTVNEYNTHLKAINSNLVQMANNSSIVNKQMESLPDLIGEKGVSNFMNFKIPLKNMVEDKKGCSEK